MVNVSVIGCGYWGPNLVRNLNESLDCRVVKVSDLKPGRLKYIGQRYPHIGLTSDHREILADPSINGVFIATPIPTHYALAKESLLAGKHVFVEKPLAYSVKEAEELVNLAEEVGKVLAVGQIFEHHPALAKVKELIDNGELGDIYYIDSSRINLGPPASPVNVVWDLAPHDVSIILFLTGEQPIEASAVGNGYIRSGFEEMAYITLRFPNGVLGHIHVSWLAPCKLRRTQIMGSKKVIVFDDTESVEKVKIFGEGIDTRTDADDFGEFQLTYRAGDIHVPHLDNREPLRIECEDFINSIMNGGKAKSDGQSGLRVVEVLEAAQKSIRNAGQWIPIKH